MIRWTRIIAGVVLIALAPSVRGETTVPEIDAINPSLAALDPAPNLETPQACVENFVLSAQRGDFERAARSLNFRLVAEVTDASAATAAERLFFVLNQELWIDWEALPDRADGMIDRALLTDPGPLVGETRTGIRLGSIEIDGRDVPIRLQRVQAPDHAPVWLFSAQTVDNIAALYDAHGPGWLDQNLPEWAAARGWQRIAIWKWIALGVIVIVAPLLGWLSVRVVKRVIGTVVSMERSALARFDWPIIAVVTSGLILICVDGALSLPSAVARIIDPIALLALVASVAWLIMRAISLIVNGVAKDVIRRNHEDDSRTQRRVLTQVTVARHVLMLVVALTAIGVVMVQLGVFRTLGIAMLSSAGAAAVILGLASQAVLGNLIAGLQIALTQPFTLGDTVLIEGRWGSIEDITYTYVVVRTWDERRLVFPIKYFIDHWFENWSMSDSFTINSIRLHVDYCADVDAIRARFLELLEGDDDWDREHDEPEVLVTEIEDDTMIVRLTCGGATPAEAWSLHCRMRERMLAWLQEQDGGTWLPRRRVELRGDATAVAPDDARES